MGVGIWALINPPTRLSLDVSGMLQGGVGECSPHHRAGILIDSVDRHLGALYRHPVEPRTLEASKRSEIFGRDTALVQHTNHG